MSFGEKGIYIQWFVVLHGGDKSLKAFVHYQWKRRLQFPMNSRLHGNSSAKVYISCDVEDALPSLWFHGQWGHYRCEILYDGKQEVCI